MQVRSWLSVRPWWVHILLSPSNNFCTQAQHNCARLRAIPSTRQVTYVWLSFNAPNILVSSCLFDFSGTYIWIPNRTEGSPPFYKFQKFGTCPYGDRCKFLHDAETEQVEVRPSFDDIKTPAQPHAQFSPTPTNQKVEQCKDQGEWQTSPPCNSVQYSRNSLHPVYVSASQSSVVKYSVVHTIQFFFPPQMIYVDFRKCSSIAFIFLSENLMEYILHAVQQSIMMNVTSFST